MELDVKVVKLLTDGGMVSVSEDVFLAELERRRVERKQAVRRQISQKYYGRNRDKIVGQQRDYRRSKKEGVAPAPVQTV